MTPDVPAPVVRALQGRDRAAWESLWAGYLAFYGEDVDPEVTHVVFHRLVDPGWQRQFGLVAEVDGVLRGFAHVGLQHSTWAIPPDAYLEDLFVDPAVRGDGVGRALLERLVDDARELGWRRVHWLTDTGNEVARRLYDRVGEVADQVRYTVTTADRDD